VQWSGQIASIAIQSEPWTRINRMRGMGRLPFRFALPVLGRCLPAFGAWWMIDVLPGQGNPMWIETATKLHMAWSGSHTDHSSQLATLRTERGRNGLHQVAEWPAQKPNCIKAHGLSGSRRCRIRIGSWKMKAESWESS